MITFKRTALAVGIGFSALVSSIIVSATASYAAQLDGSNAAESTKLASGIISGLVTKTYIPALQNVALESALVKHSGDADVSIDAPNVVNVHSGEVIVHASHPTVVLAGQHKLVLESGTISLISNQSDLLKVRNLYETKGYSLRVHLAKSYLTLATGQELVIARDLSGLNSTVTMDYVARRKVNLFKLSSGSLMMRSEYLPATLMKRTDLLKQLYLSKDASDQSLSKRLIKMAACLAYATASHGNFKYVTP